MKLKGLVWFFTIALILISLWELSYTWVVRNYESGVTEQATKIARRVSGETKGDKFDAALKFTKDSILLASKDKAIYPLVGTSYQKCKENELNLGLDLQGGISVTLDVSLDGLLKSLSNNSKDPTLLKAIATANERKAQSQADFITLFKNAFIEQNGSGKLSGLFAGQGKDIKISDDDGQVISKLSVTAKGAIKETYKVLLNGIDSPEPGQNYAEQAKRLLGKLLLNKTVTITLRGKDRLGNRLGDIHIDGASDPRNELIKEGLCWTSEKEPVAEFESLKEEARAKGKGLWSDENPTPPWTYRRQQTMTQQKSS